MLQKGEHNYAYLVIVCHAQQYKSTDSVSIEICKAMTFNQMFNSGSFLYDNHKNVYILFTAAGGEVRVR